MPHRSARPLFLARTVLGCTLLAAAGCAHAQWKWIGPGGVVQYSDQPPPLGTPARNILSRPATVTASPPAAPASKPAAKDAAAQALEKKLQEQKQAQAEQQKAQQAQQAEAAAANARAREQNCVAAQQQLRTLDSGMRIAQVNAQGQREYLDEAQLAQMRAQAQAAIVQNCR